MSRAYVSSRVASGTVLLAGLALALTATADDIPGHRPACVSVRPHAWNAGPGWNHLVTVRNTCTAAVHCTVTTDANPAPTPVDVAPGSEETVNTFLHSPASGFHPTVDCTQ